jgi:hypothetical protein
MRMCVWQRSNEHVASLLLERRTTVAHMSSCEIIWVDVSDNE